LVVTGVADRLPGAVHTLVYLDAFLPSGDQSLFDLVPPEASAPLAAQARARADGCIPPIPAELFNVNPGDRAWVDSLCTPQPLATFTERLRLIGGLEAVERRVYALARDNTLGGGFQAFHAQAAADPKFRSCVLPGGHDLMIDSPGHVTRLLLDGFEAAL
jgi:hypothetical protein